ncbi:MAG TPA: FtsQ-type POTRA domain-containing protein [Acidimicrobiales bacterium]|nr:FtsQ-type POTRA domain-containing protein [Acidimicrobiales bacterium]
MGITAVTLLAGGGWVATGSRALDVDHIVVLGAVHTTPAEAAAAAHVHRGQRMVNLDLAAAARGVRTLPWVGTATVDREWPGSVRIRVTERVPAAALPADAGGADVVDATGRVLARADDPPAGLALLAGLPPAGAPGSTLSADGVAALEVAVALPDELRARVLGVGPVGGTTGEVELRLGADATVRLGPPDDLQRKFDAVRAVLAQVDMRNLAVLDVRRPDSPVLTRRGAPTKVSTPRAG